jgi:hypothetical protein
VIATAPFVRDTRQRIDKRRRRFILRRLPLYLLMDLSGVVNETDPKVGAA